MDKTTCLKKLQLVGVLSFATVGLDGSPQVRCISAIHFEEDSFYFFTARGKNFCRELLCDGRVQIMAYTKYKEMIRVSAKAKPVSDEKQTECMQRIFEEQPYLERVYPGGTKEIGIIFEVRDMEVEYFNLGVHPIFRETYPEKDGKIKKNVYEITDSCIGCGRCAAHCPQKCITAGKPFVISQQHCLHCGNCFEQCPINAVQRKED